MRPDRWTHNECYQRAQRLNSAQELWLLVEVLRWSPSGLGCLPAEGRGDPFPPDHWKFTGRRASTALSTHHCLNPDCVSKAPMLLGAALDHSGYDETTCPEIRDVDVEMPPHKFGKGRGGPWKPDPALLFSDH